MRFFNLQTPSAIKKIFITAIFLAMIIIGAYCYLWTKIIQKTRNVAAILGEMEALNNEREVFASIKGRIEETVSVREKLVGFFIPKDGVVSFLNMIQALGVENKLEFKVDSVTIEDEADAPETFENVKLNIEAEGAWADIYKFVALVELLPLRVFADKVDLQVANEEARSGSTSKSKVASGSQSWKSSISLRVLKLK